MHNFPLPITIIGIIVTLWVIPWKIYAVWMAARRDNKKWFIALLFLNTLAILEIYYIFKVAKKSSAEVKADFKQAVDSVKK